MMPPSSSAPDSRTANAPKHRVRKFLKYGSIGLLAVTLLLAITLRVRYGGGAPYPDLSGPPTFPENDLQVAATYDEPIGNIAVSNSGRLFFSVHPESRPPSAKVLEWIDGKAVPFPNDAAQSTLFETVLGLAIDRQNRLWTIDHGNHGFGQARLLAFDLDSREVVHEHLFSSEIAQMGSFLQDLQVDSAGQTVYIADVSFWRRNPGIVVYALAQQRARRVLDGHVSVFPQDWIIRNPSKDMVFFAGLVALKAGVDGIAISRDDEWLYYAAMNHETLYRIRTDMLRDPSLAPETVAAAVEAVGKKPLNDGLSTDIAGNILITDVEHGAILRMTPSATLETLIKSERIRWADALSYGPDGWLYIADSAIPEQMLRSKAHIASQAPYYIYRFRPGIDSVAGQ